AVRQEDVRAIAEMLGQDRVELAEDVEVYFERVARVHVLVVATLPAKSLARNGGQAGHVDVAAGEDAAMLFREVLADDRDQPGACEEAGSVSEVRRRSAQRVI